MGNAIVSRLFHDIFAEYILFTIVLWVLIYVWGMPSLLISDGAEHKSLKSRLLSFINSMYIYMLIGIVMGLLEIPLPTFFTDAVKTTGDLLIRFLLSMLLIVKLLVNKEYIFSLVQSYAAEGGFYIARQRLEVI